MKMKFKFILLIIFLLYSNLSVAVADDLFSLDLASNGGSDKKSLFPKCAEAPLDFKNCTKSRCHDISPMGIIYRELEGQFNNSCIYKEQLTDIGGIECKLPLSKVEDFANIIKNQYRKGHQFLLHGKKNPISDYCKRANLDRKFQLITLNTNPLKILYINEKLIQQGNEVNKPTPRAEKLQLLGSIMLNKTVTSTKENFEVPQDSILLDSIFYISHKNWTITLNKTTYTYDNQPKHITVLEAEGDKVVLSYEVKDLEQAYPEWQDIFIERAGNIFIHRTNSSIKLKRNGNSATLLLTMSAMQYFDAKNLSIASKRPGKEVLQIILGQYSKVRAQRFCWSCGLGSSPTLALGISMG